MRRARTWVRDLHANPWFCSEGLGLSFPVWQMKGLVPQLLTLLVRLSGVFTLPEAMIVVSWPGRVSVTGMGKVRDSLGCPWGCRQGFTPTPLPLQPVGLLAGQRGSTDVSAVFEKCPSLYLRVSQSWPFPPVVQAHLSHGIIASASLLLGIREGFLEGWWCCVVKTGPLI